MVLKGGKATQKASISINSGAKQKLCSQIWVQILALLLARYETLGKLLNLLLLLLSCFSRVQLCATPKTAAHQAPTSLGFSRQEHWSALPFPSPMYESEK